MISDLSRSLPLLLGMLILAALPARAEKVVYPEWQKPQRFVFGMPYIGHVVRPDETGMATEVLLAIFKQRDTEFEHRNMPYPHALEEVKKGTIHCSLALSDESDPKKRGKAAILLYDLAVAYRIKEGFQGVEAMEGENVGFLQGFGIKKRLKVKIHERPAYDLTSLLHRLDRNQVKYVLDEEILIKEALLEAKLPTSEFGIQRLATLGVYPVFAPTEAGQDFRALYDTRIQELAKSGRLRKILRKNGLPEEKIDRLFKLNGF